MCNSAILNFAVIARRLQLERERYRMLEASDTATSNVKTTEFRAQLHEQGCN